MNNNSQPEKKNNRSKFALLISPSGLFGFLGAIFVVGLAVYSDNFIVSGFVVVFLIIPAIKRFIRHKSVNPLSEQGQGTSDNYSISNGMVQVRNGGKIWSKPLSEYEGVLRHEETSSFGRKSRNRTRQVIDLRHRSDREFDVNLYTSREDIGIRARWEKAAQEFNLPALRDLGDGDFLRQEPEDVGKSLRELARENVLDVSFADDAPVPRGTKWSLNGNVLKVDQQRTPLGCFIITSPFLLFYTLVSYNLPFGALLGNNDAALLPLYRGLAFVLPILITGIWIFISIQIRVTPNDVTVIGKLGPIPLWQQVLSLDDVEEVLVDSSLVVWQSILIESISKTLRIWPLNEESAQWVAQFLRSAIANAPNLDDDSLEES